MFATHIRPEDVDFILLRNKRGFSVQPGTYREDRDTNTATFVHIGRNGQLRRMTVDCDFIAVLNGDER